MGYYYSFAAVSAATKLCSLTFEHFSVTSSLPSFNFSCAINVCVYPPGLYISSGVSTFVIFVMMLSASILSMFLGYYMMSRLQLVIYRVFSTNESMGIMEIS